MAALIGRRPRMPARIERLNRRRLFSGDRTLRATVAEWGTLAGCVIGLAVLWWSGK